MKKKKISFYDTEEFSITFRYITLFGLTYFFLSSFFLDFMIEIFLYMSYYFLKIFTQVNLVDGILYLSNNYQFLIVKECIAPSAYILISLVFLTLPVKLEKIYLIWFKSILWFSFFNIVRIFLLMWIHVEFGVLYFEKVHLLFYEGLSGIVVALIVIYYLRNNDIKKIYPIFSDVKHLFNSMKSK